MKVSFPAVSECRGRFQAIVIKLLQIRLWIELNSDNEDIVIVLGEDEWEDLFENSMEVTSFNGFSCESSIKDDIDINYNNKEKQTWTNTLNTAVMEYYFLGRPVDDEGKPVTKRI